MAALQMRVAHGLCSMWRTLLIPGYRVSIPHALNPQRILYTRLPQVAPGSWERGSWAKLLCFPLSAELGVQVRGCDQLEGRGTGQFGKQHHCPPFILPTDFVPIDLDEWWAQQFLAKITNCS